MRYLFHDIVTGISQVSFEIEHALYCRYLDIDHFFYKGEIWDLSYLTDREVFFQTILWPTKFIIDLLLLGKYWDSTT